MKPKTESLVNAFGFLYMEEAELLMNTADKLREGAVVINIGAGAGTSALAVRAKTRSFQDISYY